MSLLPVVNPDVGHAIAANFSDDKSDRKVIAAELKRISRENPAIANFIGDWAKQMKGEGAIHSAFCGVLVYKLLHSQAEADQMAEEINLG